MLRLGEVQELEIIKKVDFGVYLFDPQEGNPEERVLLPIAQAPDGSGKGDRLEVFLYKDSSDRLISTTRRPLLQLGQTALLKVAQVGKLGVFLEWGLEKDLFLPFREQTKRVQEGEECLVALYIDRSERLCATMKVYPYLRTDSPYRKNDRVAGLVYEISKDFGVFVAVDNCYSGLIPQREVCVGFQPGDRVSLRVAAVKPDGKLDLTVREKAPVQIAADAGRVRAALEQAGGSLPFNDKASPETIREHMQMSKNEFKRAVGRLLKQNQIEITENAIRLR